MTTCEGHLPRADGVKAHICSATQIAVRLPSTATFVFSFSQASCHTNGTYPGLPMCQHLAQVLGVDLYFAFILTELKLFIW